jgi:peptidoglycan hydrolase-like protein with peptidoglycan-binding domain
MLAITTQTSPSLAQTAPLNYGTHGPEVAEVQSRLVELGFFYHCATGFFGPLTKSAVLAFQQAHGLEMDGVVGPRTQQLLFNETGFATVEAGARSQPEPVQQPPVQQPPVQQTVAQGTATAELQAQLQDWGYYQGAIDGVHGPQTDRALRHFQQDQGLVADGIAGERTMAALNGARASGYEPSSTFEREPIIDPNPQILLPPPPPPLS